MSKLLRDVTAIEVISGRNYGAFDAFRDVLGAVDELRSVLPAHCAWAAYQVLHAVSIDPETGNMFLTCDHGECDPERPEEECDQEECCEKVEEKPPWVEENPLWVSLKPAHLMEDKEE